MTVATVPGWDVTHRFINSAPRTGQASLYITGSADIVATGQDITNHPGAVLIDQSPVITAVDMRADVFDGENGAITPAEVAQIIKDAQHAYTANERPGQRWPMLYCSRSQVTTYVNALVAGGVMQCPLFIADWNNSVSQATAEVANGTGPYPVCGRQYSNMGAYDLDVYSANWLYRVSGPVKVPVVLEQRGTVHSYTTGGNAEVETDDGGMTWTFGANS